MHRSFLVTVVVAAVSCHSPHAVVHHFDDDYEAARVEAANAKLPLVVEVWAPW